jgi:hypothetical protein
MSENIKSFIGLTSVKEATKLVRQEKRQARNDFADELVAYHEKYNLEQEKLEADFDSLKLKKINVNIWDDFESDSCVTDGELQETYAYVEELKFPDKLCLDILSSTILYINSNNLLPEKVNMSLKFYDSTTKYPILVGENEYSLYKRWQIEFKGITHKILDDLIDKLELFEPFNHIKLNIYSES